MLSPLRYPGGKAKLFAYFVQIISLNKLYGKQYSEPFAGGVGLALKLLHHGYVSTIELNDADPAIAAFWNCVLNQADEFCDLIQNVDLSVEEWRKQRQAYSAGLDNGELALGFAAYYLNRTSRSGIIEGSGPIGGYSQSGEWKIDARFNRDRQVEQIMSIRSCKERIKISCLDALDFLKERITSKDHLIYLDPPYYVKGSKLYRNFYCHSDHEKIGNLLNQSRSGNWILSYDHSPEIIEIYSSFTPTTYSLQYSAGGSPGQGREVIFSSDNIVLPEFEGFRSAA